MLCGDSHSGNMDVARDGWKELPVRWSVVVLGRRWRCSDESLSASARACFVSSAGCCYRWLRVRRGDEMRVVFRRQERRVGGQSGGGGGAALR